jgi:2-oxoglutarate dehydrogenase E1 component
MMKELIANSYLSGANAAFVEQLYESYLDNPESVAPEWRRYFDQLQQSPGSRDVAHTPIIESFAQRARSGAPRQAPSVAALDRKQVSVIQLVAEYRFRGVLLADLDPLKRRERPRIVELEPGYYDLTEEDMDTVFNTGSLIRSRQPCAKSSRRCRKPIAARSASSTCI